MKSSEIEGGDLRNQLALAYEGEPKKLRGRLRTGKDINEIFRRAQAAFNAWSTFPPEERTPAAILKSPDFDFLEVLDSVTIARSRKHIETFYDTEDIGTFPERRLKPVSFPCQLTHRADVIGFNDIFNQLSLLKLAVFAPVTRATDARPPLPVALDLAGLYEQMSHCLTSVPSRAGEPLQSYAERVSQIRAKEKQCRREAVLQRRQDAENLIAALRRAGRLSRRTAAELPVDGIQPIQSLVRFAKHLHRAKE